MHQVEDATYVAEKNSFAVIACKLNLQNYKQLHYKLPTPQHDITIVK